LLLATHLNLRNKAQIQADALKNLHSYPCTADIPETKATLMLSNLNLGKVDINPHLFPLGRAV
jgi:hypothetical protein